MEDRVEAAIVNFPVVSEFWIGANGWKTEPESLRKLGRISGKQTEQVIFQHSHIWRLEDVSALSLGCRDACSLSPGGHDSDESEDASSGKNSVY